MKVECDITDGVAPGQVLVSRSTDVFENLALEQWLDSSSSPGARRLLLWRNRPAVVIGRHQNPWAECDLAAARRRGVALARRRSGGGAVYHDLGNLNVTFLAPREAYDRRRNLSVVTGALRRARPGLDVLATERLDVVLNGSFKISGSASRLSRTPPYHHCTLLHSADRSAPPPVLRPSCPGIHSNATPSVPSPVANLLDHDPTLQWDELLEALVQQYNAEFGYDAVMAPVDPADELAFPGVGQLAAELRGWDWTFGRTPKFSVQSVLDLRDATATSCSARLRVEVKAGLVQSCELDVPSHWLPGGAERRAGRRAGRGPVLPGSGAAAAVAVVMRAESGERRRRLHHLGDALVSAIG
ncbi:hypothetical protein EPR50_G00113720 [Perca flavescens]|uniref:BPL/LPL catalytic domain-containing protein n=1 Tax=Perca flavescens TaxID=8167 RepID=A0A484CS86_PERFV|nr:hypothetical protein EPR50_G00113720 [Perca flavescens]